MSPTEINEAYRGLIDLFRDLDPTVEMALANSTIWAELVQDLGQTLGTEAAAVTSVEVRIVSAAPPPIIRVDRPFVMAIRERISGTILFLGLIEDPRGE